MKSSYFKQVPTYFGIAAIIACYLEFSILNQYEMLPIDIRSFYSTQRFLLGGKFCPVIWVVNTTFSVQEN